MNPQFQRRREDFKCQNCGQEVKGDGYTNHCPKCLYSKHVDVNPGDRAATCEGLMKPIAVEGSTGTGYSIVQRCQKCGHERRNRVEKEDVTDALIALAQTRKGV